MRRLFAVALGLVGFGAVVVTAAPPATTRAVSTVPTTAVATTAAATRPATAPSMAPSTSPSTAPAPTTAADRPRSGTPSVNLADTANSANNASGRLDALAGRIAANDITGTVDSSLWAKTAEIAPRLADNKSQLSPTTSLETLRGLDAGWDQDKRLLNGWSDELLQRDGVLTEALANLAQVGDDMQAKRAAVEASHGKPGVTRPVLELIDATLLRSQQLTNSAAWEQNKLKDLRDTILSTNIGVDDALSAVRDAERKARDRLLDQDSPPLWSALFHPSKEVSDVAEQGRNSAASQWLALKTYVSAAKPRLLLHLAGVMTLAAVLIWLRRQTRQWTGSDPSLLAATRIFQTPIATAITASMIVTPWVYPTAPRLFWGIVGTGALLPTIWTLRPLIERSLRPLLYGLAGAELVNLVLAIVSGLPLVFRAIFLGQMGGAAVFFLWFLRTGHGVPGDAERPPLRKAAVIGARFGLVVTVVSCLANVFGYVSLSRLVGGALLTSAYLGVLLDTGVHVLDALMLGLSHLRPISTLGMVQRHRPLLLKRVRLLVVVLAVGLWGYFTLDALSIRPVVISAAETVWAFPKDVDHVFGTPASRAAAMSNDVVPADANKSPAAPTTAPAASPMEFVLRLGPASPAPAAGVSPAPAAAPAAATPTASADASDKGSVDTLSNTLYVGGIVSFCFTLAASIFIARFVAFLLDEDVYPRLHLARGMPYAITTLLRYVVLAIGFTLAIAKLGYNDLTKLTILVSAFGVGLGFGMQNIVNNFVSGLILLFERPVQVGDVIELDNFTGVVSRIGIRASIVRTPLAAEIIVPNGRLISDRVINWTLSNRQRGVELSVTVTPDTDPQHLIQVLAAAAKSHPLVAAYPAPQAYFVDFSGGGLKFEVRAWTNRFEDWTTVRSELAIAINAVLLKEKVTLK